MCWWGIFVIVWPLGHPFQPCEESQHRGNRLLAWLWHMRVSLKLPRGGVLNVRSFPTVWLCLNPLVRVWVFYSGEAAWWRPLGLQRVKGISIGRFLPGPSSPQVCSHGRDTEPHWGPYLALLLLLRHIHRRKAFEEDFGTCSKYRQVAPLQSPRLRTADGKDYLQPMVGTVQKTLRPRSCPFGWPFTLSFFPPQEARPCPRPTPGLVRRLCPNTVLGIRTTSRGTSSQRRFRP